MLDMLATIESNEVQSYPSQADWEDYDRYLDEQDADAKIQEANEKFDDAYYGRKTISRA